IGAAEPRDHITRTIHVFASEVKIWLPPPHCDKRGRITRVTPIQSNRVLWRICGTAPQFGDSSLSIGYSTLRLTQQHQRLCVTAQESPTQFQKISAQPNRCQSSSSPAIPNPAEIRAPYVAVMLHGAAVTQ